MRNIIKYILILIIILNINKIYGQGNTCDDPIVINSLPYDMNNFNACGYGNDYQDGSGSGNGLAPACASHWMNGDEVVFAYTPTTDEDVFITYQISDWDGGFYILDACPISTANCIYSANDPDTDEDIPICGLTFEAGHTYYIVFSYDDDDDWNDCYDFSYDFHIESVNPSVAPTVQDCLGAIPVCQDVYTESNSYVGNGNINCEVNMNTTCIAFGDLNYVWYTFTVQSGGQLSFDITPNNSNDDYDWTLYDLNNYTCDELYSAPNSDLACDFDGLDNTNNPNSLTGMSPSGQCSSCGNGNAYQNSINVNAGETYVLMVNNFSSSQNGFTLDFGPSTAEIYDTTPPEFESVETPIPCGATQLTFTMSENILCNTADASDIQLTGPGGPYSVTNISSTVCDLGGQYDNTFTITVSPALTSSGNFNLSLTPSGSFSDFCGNVANNASFDFTIDNIQVTTSVTDITDCNTLCDGSISITNPTGGTAPYSYSWSSNAGASGSSASNLCEDTYSVTVSDAAGCDAVIDTPIVIVANCGPTITLTANPTTICAGETTTLTQTTTNGTPGYTYNWDNGLSGTGPNTVSPTTTTTYNVTVTDSNNDSQTASVTVTVNPLPTADAGNDQTVCDGASITLTATGGTPTWDNGVTDGVSFTPTSTTTYTVTVTDGNGCEDTDDVLVTVNPLPTANAGQDQSICDGTSVALTATGGTPVWDNGVNDGVSFTPTSTTTYTVTVTDGNGCEDTDDVLVTVNSLPTANAGNDQSVCDGTSVTLSATGGTPAWDNGVNDGVSFTPTSTTTYTVTVTDANGCENTDDVIVTVNPNPTVTAATDVNVICPPASANLSAIGSGGSGSYTYDWSPSSTLDDATDNQYPVASPSTINTNYTYTVTVTDDNGCTGINTVDVFVSCNPVPVLSSTDTIICLGESATFDISVNGGMTPYNTPYTWDNGLSGTGSQTVTPTVTTTYCVTVTDANGATGSDCITIVVNPLPTANAGQDQAICLGQETAQLSATGGVDYTWDNGTSLTATNISNPVANPTSTTTYTVIVTDANGCENTDDVIITVNGLPNANAGADQDLCDGYSTTVDASGSTGAPPLSFSWDHGLGNGNPQTVSPILTTLYTVTVTDANGCKDTDETTVNIVSAPTVSAGQDVEICQGESTQLQASGGVTYQWDNTASLNNGNIYNPVASPANTTTYTVTVSDATGCWATDDVTITVNPIPVANAGQDQAICYGESISIQASGGVNYSWSIPASGASQTVSPTSTTTYTVTVYDGTAANCSSTDDVTITVNPLPIITVSPSSAEICPGSAVTLTASGASTYTWSPTTGLSPATGESVGANPTNSTTYTVTGVSAEGCSSTTTVQVDVKEFYVTASADETICKGASTNIYATPSGGTAPITYYWDGVSSSQNISVSPTQETTYSIYGIDVTGCQSNTDEVTISLYPDVQLDLFANKDTVCPGDAIMVTSNIYSGSGAPYTLTDEYGTIVSTPIYVYPNGTQNYVFIAEDNCGITDADTLTLSSYNVKPLSFTSDILSGCEDLEVSFNSMDGFVSYVWSFSTNGVSDLSLEQNPTHTFTHSGTYNVTLSATDIHGCKVSNTIEDMITVYPKPEAKFSVDNDVVSYLDPIIQFYNYSSLNYYNFWSFGDGDSSITENPYHRFDNIGTYKVKLEVKTENGCTDYVYYIIEVQDEFTLYVPTAFTPDNDGINDEFIVKAHGVDLDEFKLIIYNRWGEVIWQTNDIYQGWNGITKNGKVAESGVYKWIVVCKDFNGVEFSKAGNLTIIK